MAISMLKIRRPLGRLIFNMGIAIPGKTVFLIETAPRVPLPLPLSDVSFLFIYSSINRDNTLNSNDPICYSWTISFTWVNKTTVFEYLTDHEY